MVDDLPGSPSLEPDQPVGAELARLRKQAGITGHQLGRRLSMSQAKISKIETGAVTPSVGDVRRIAEKLGAPAGEVARLLALVQRPRDAMTDHGRKDPVWLQREIGELEAATTTLRSFQPAVINGLLQTSEYARAVFTTVTEAPSAFERNGQRGIAAAISARMRRQEILGDPHKQFHFVMPETLLRNKLVEAEEMPVQLSRLRDVARQENVTLSLIADGTRWPYPPFHGFTLLDDSYLIIDLFNTIVISRGKADIRLYGQIFEAFEAAATRDIDPILNQYRQTYLQRAQND